MELSWIWHAIIIFFIGTFILRVGGRKSISQMTIAQTVVMIGLGSLLIQPLAGRGLTITFLSAFLLTILMIIAEYLQVKIDPIETLFSGKSVMVVENGTLNLNNLRRLRLSVDKLETRLRQVGVSSIDDLKYATIEVSGQLGYELKESKKPLTKEDFNILMNEISQIKAALGSNIPPHPPSSSGNNIFKEINSKIFEGKKEP